MKLAPGVVVTAHPDDSRGPDIGDDSLDLRAPVGFTLLSRNIRTAHRICARARGRTEL